MRGEANVCHANVSVQGKRHVEKKALLAHGSLSHFCDLKSKYESSVFLPHRNLKVKSRDETYQKYLEY